MEFRTHSRQVRAPHLTYPKRSNGVSQVDFFGNNAKSMAHKVLGPSQCSNGTVSLHVFVSSNKQDKRKKPELEMRHVVQKRNSASIEFYTLFVSNKLNHSNSPTSNKTMKTYIVFQITFHLNIYVCILSLTRFYVDKFYSNFAIESI